MNEQERLAAQEASDAKAEVGMFGEPLSDHELSQDELVASCRADVDAAEATGDGRAYARELCRAMRRLEARMEQDAYSNGCNAGIAAIGAMMAEESARVHP